MASIGHNVTLLAPTVTFNYWDDAFAYYGLPRSFRIVHLPNLDALNTKLIPGFLAFHISMWSYRRQLRKYFHDHQTDVLYLRSPVVLGEALRSGYPVIVELHTLPWRNRSSFVRQCNQCRLVVCLTTQMRDEIIAWGVDEQRIVLEGDGVDLSAFASLPSVDEAKHQFNLPSDRPVIGYVGSFVTQDTIEKGVRQMIDGLVALKKQGRSFFAFIVGGPERWRKEYEKYARSHGLNEHDVRFGDRIPRSDLPSLLSAFDVCVYPAPASEHPFFTRDTSPLKVFEYMAAGKPIVSADIAPIRDVLDESRAVFFAPGDALSFADAVIQTLDDPSAFVERASNAKKHVQWYGWENRMGRILDATF